MRHATMQILMLGLFLLPQHLMAQEWGDVSQDVLSMTSLPEDPEADAVILFDKGMTVITLRLELVVQRHTRIKILTEQGLKYADVSIAMGSRDKIEKLKAHAILPSGKKVEVKKKDIFTKKRGGRVDKVFAIPGVEVGAVIEYSYEITSKGLTFLAPWQFQHREFTKLSELTLIVPEGLDYRAFASNSNVPEPSRESFQIADATFGTAVLGRFVWRAENLPAIKPEPYITTLKNYWATLNFQIVSYRNPKDTMSEPNVFVKTWDDLAELLHKGYKPYLRQNRAVTKQTLAIAPEDEDTLTRVRAIYSYVRDSIQTASTSGRKRPSDLIKQKKGDSTEKNLLLIAMLRTIDLEAHPFMLSSRTHGRFDENLAQLQQLNRTVVHLTVDKKVYFLDANDTQCPFGLLPANLVSEKGLLVLEEDGEIVKIPQPKDAYHFRAETEAQLTDSGDLICETTLTCEGYGAVSERKKLIKTTPEKYVKEILEDRFGEVTVDTFQIEQADDVEKPLVVKVAYQVQNYAQVVGDMYYCPTSLIHQQESNPFKREKRHFPVEFNYGREYTETVHLSLPEGVSIVEMPEEQKVRSFGLVFASTCEADSNAVKFKRTYDLNRMNYTPAQYSRLRDAYAQMVSADQGQMVLKKNAAE